MNVKYENVIALCLKDPDFACTFDDCPLFHSCYPEEKEQ